MPQNPPNPPHGNKPTPPHEGQSGQPHYTYERNDQGIVQRSDGALVPEHEPDNPVTKIYQDWLKENQPPPELTEEQKRREHARLHPPMPDTHVEGPQGHRAGWNEDSDAP